MPSSELSVLNVVTKVGQDNPCPRCERHMDRVDREEASLACSKPFSFCTYCKQTWQDDELTEARDQAGIYDDVRSAYFEDTRRGKRKGNSVGGLKRKKNLLKPAGHLVDDWNLGAGWATGSVTSTETRTKPVDVRFPEGSNVVELANRANVKMSDLVRLSLQAAFEKISRIA